MIQTRFNILSHLWEVQHRASYAEKWQKVGEFKTKESADIFSVAYKAGKAIKNAIAPKKTAQNDSKRAKNKRK